MPKNASYLKCAVTAVFASLVFLPSANAQDAELDTLFEGLKTADTAASAQIEGRIQVIWSQSGSPSMDLLLSRGRQAMSESDFKLAIEHFSALIDHAPDFAEGYNARATAYYQTGQCGMSLEDSQKTLSLNPRHFGAMSGLALIFEEIGKPEGALAAWREVARINPNREGLQETIERLERLTVGRDI